MALSSQVMRRIFGHRLRPNDIFPSTCFPVTTEYTISCFGNAHGQMRGTVISGIAFGFFEDLPSDDRNRVEDILYGATGLNKKPELPWEAGVTGLSPFSDANAMNNHIVEMIYEPVCEPKGENTDLEESAKDPNVSDTVSELASVDSNTVQASGHMEATPGQTMHNMVPAGSMYPPPPTGIPVVPGLPHPVGPVMYVYPPHYIMPHPGMSQAPQPVHVPPELADQMNDFSFSENSEMSTENNNKYPADKEAIKILGGKTYERRNKKRRPPNYYQTLAQKPQTVVSMTEERYNILYTGHNLPVSHGPVYHPMGPTGHGLPSHYHPNIAPMVMDTASHPTPHHLVSSVLSPGAHYPGVGVPITHFAPPGVLTCAPPPPSDTKPEINHSLSHSQQTESPCIVGETPVTNASQPTQDKCLSNELYTVSRTAPQVSEISFGDVDGNIRNIDNEKTVLPCNSGTSYQQKQPEAENINNIEKKPVSVSLVDCDPPDNESEPAEIPDGPLIHHVADNGIKLCSNDSDAIEFESNTQQEDASNQTISSAVSVQENDLDHPTPVNSQQIQAETSAEPIAADNLTATNETSKIDHDLPTTVAPAAVTKPKPVSWAGLFHKTPTAENATVIYQAQDPLLAVLSETKETARKEEEKLPVTVSMDKDKAANQLGDLVKEYVLSYKSINVQPRGLVNRGNWCYVNATLQALVNCAPFYNLLKYLPFYPTAMRGPSSTPIIDSMVELVNEFNILPEQKPQEKNNKPTGKGNIRYDVPTGPVFEPTQVYKMLQVIKYDGFKSGRQEDAEEFLSCVLNGLHDEMVAAIKAATPDINAESTDAVTTNGDAETYETNADDSLEDGWEQVGPRNKSVITRNVSVKFDTSPISEIFRGQFRNILNRPGVKESATLQPFFTLQLDIQCDKVCTVQEALENLVSKEALKGFTCSKTKQEVDASRRTLLEDLPPVLILHLKCFVYDKNGGSMKIVKQVNFSQELEIVKENLSPNVRNKIATSNRKYKLFAVVKHVGIRAAGGHYTTDIYHQALGEWLHFDDNLVTTVPMTRVFKFQAPRVPYLLYYRRADLS